MKFINLQHLQDPMRHLRERYRQPPIFLPERGPSLFQIVSFREVYARLCWPINNVKE